MTLLLDTHALLWALGAPERIPESLREQLTDRRTRLLVSAASAFEIATQHRLGRLPEATALVHDFDGIVARFGAEPLPITARHAITAGAMDWSHRDPFDRMLAAQAMTDGVALVTADPVFAGVPGLVTCWSEARDG